MLTKPNFQRLLDVAKATEECYLDEFRMDTVSEIHPCGTVGCLVGNYNAMTGRDAQCFLRRYGSHIIEPDHLHFGITVSEYQWLFLDCAALDGWRSKRRELYRTTKEQALRRLRLFLYYKMHKHELCCDTKYGVSQKSRTLEGNHGFAMRALEECVV